MIVFYTRQQIPYNTNPAKQDNRKEEEVSI